MGGYGRGSLCPYSDLDVVLVHNGHRDIGKVADAIWYPVWDEGVHLDHSVRRPSEVLSAAAEDVRVALGLLDGRLVWGETKVAEPLLEKARAAWRDRFGARYLPLLQQQMAERRATAGDVAFLLEPDLKESHGGLRDVSVLRAISAFAPLLADYADLDSLNGATALLTDIRVELHRLAQREHDKLLLQDQDQVAAALGFVDADALMLAVSTAGRQIAWVSDDVWRRRRLWDPTPATETALSSQRARPRHTPDTGGSRARHGRGRRRNRPDVARPGLRSTPRCRCAWPPPQPSWTGPSPRDRCTAWPTACHRPATHGRTRHGAALVSLLALGRPAIDKIESLDQHGLLVRLIPEWAAVRNKPQRNAYHTYTVDRHLLEAAALAAELTDTVERPDLLLVGTLLHDIGKGFPGDHTTVGIEVVDRITTRMGFAPADVAVLVDLVRQHLLLPDTATRRDLDDPTTIARVARAVGNRLTLHLLAALTEADSRATGPSAWGAWKAGLVADLVERTDRVLQGETEPTAPDRIVTSNQELIAEVRDPGLPSVSLQPPHVIVAAPDRPGLFSSVAGALALNGMDVRAANVGGEDGVAVEVFTVEVARGTWPDTAKLREDLAAVLSDRLAIGERLSERERIYPLRRGSAAHLPGSDVKRRQRGLRDRHRPGDPGARRDRHASPHHPCPLRCGARRGLGSGLHARRNGR